MEKIKIFISYSSDDDTIMDRLRKAIDKSEKLKAVVVPMEESGFIKTDDKVIKEIENCDEFVSILTEKSIKTQWVNQELGYARCFFRQKLNVSIKTLVEFKIKDDLKGFVTRDTDFQYKYSSDQELEIMIDKIANDLHLKYKDREQYYIS